MSALARLLEQATPGPWEYRVWGRDGDEWPDSRVSVGTTIGHGEAVVLNPRYGERTQDVMNSRLIALAPDMARLLIDHRAWFETATWARYDGGSGWFCRWCSLDKSLGHADECGAGRFLARFAELEQRAAP